jgi:hypothetical protein
MIDQVLRNLTNVTVTAFSAPHSARRVLFWYRLLFIKPVIVVLKVPERQSGEKYSQLTSTVRELTDTYGIKVIVDGSPNSIPPELLTTSRDLALPVYPMTKEMIESIPEYADMIAFLKKHNLFGVAYDIIGGVPARFEHFLDVIPTTYTGTSEVAAAISTIKGRLQSQMADELRLCERASHNTKQMMSWFEKVKVTEIPTAELMAEEFMVDYPNKVFRESKKDNRWVVAPANPCMGLIIREQLKNSEDIRNFIDRLHASASH